MDELVKRGYDGSVEFIEMRDFEDGWLRVPREGRKKPCGERRIDLLKQFEESDAQAIAGGKKLISSGSGHFPDQALGAEFRKVVTEVRMVSQWPCSGQACAALHWGKP